MGKTESLGDEIKEKLGEIIKVVAPGLYYGAEAIEKTATAHPEETKKLEQVATAVAPGAYFAAEAVEHASRPSASPSTTAPKTPGGAKTK